MIHELLTEGRENARTGRELAAVLNLNIRDVTEAIEAERRAGFPICAASGDNPGYYLAATPEELERYCKALYKRGGELFKTRRALLSVLKQLQEKRGNDGQEKGSS